MNKKIILITKIAFCLFLICTFTSCKKKEHIHEWNDATCTTPKTCKTCNETSGNALGHNWVDATCTTPKTCKTCNETSGNALGHNWVDATCTSPKTCKNCSATTGDALDHDWVDATCTTPKTCKICNKTEGTALGHMYDDDAIQWNWSADYTTATATLTCKTDTNHQEKINATITSEETKAVSCLEAGEISYTATITYNGKSYSTKQTTIVEPLGHTWIDATYDQPKTCKNCGIVEGDPLPFFAYKLNKQYVFLGEKARLTIQDYFSFDNLTITYSEPNIIEIDNYGQIKSIHEGITSVTISLTSNPNRFFSFSFEVLGERPILVANYKKMTVGDVATLYFKNMEGSLNDYEFTFAHNNILELTSDYQLKAIDMGDEVVTYSLKSDPRISNTLSLSVVDTSTNLLIYSENPSGFMQANAQMQMTNNKGIDNTEFTWISYDKNIAIVSEKGIVIALKEGFVSICAKNETTKEVVEYNIKIEGFANVDYISRLLHLAIGENGVHETDVTGTYPCSDNYQKYGEWYHNNGNAWCATFVSWCWHFSGLSTDLLCKYQGCTAGMKWCTEQDIMHYVQDYDFGDIEMENGASPKQYKTDYQPVSGDIVFFLSSGMGHTGIVIYADETYLYTIEGNTSDQVAIKRWSLNDARITGYASPHYPEYVGKREDFSWIKEQKEDGTYWWKAVSLVEKVD